MQVHPRDRATRRVGGELDEDHKDLLIFSGRQLADGVAAGIELPSLVDGIGEGRVGFFALCPQRLDGIGVQRDSGESLAVAGGGGRRQGQQQPKRHERDQQIRQTSR
jgi:hypothetical protein